MFSPLASPGAFVHVRVGTGLAMMREEGVWREEVAGWGIYLRSWVS